MFGKKPQMLRRVSFILTLLLSAALFALPPRYRQWFEPTAFAAAKTFTVNVTGDGVDANPGNGICETSISGNCSLRAAIQEANMNSGTDTINFSIPGAGLHTISPNSALPSITDAVVINGYSQPGTSENTLTNGDNAVLLIELTGSSTGQINNGLDIESAGSTVKGLIINGFTESMFFSPSGVGINLQGDGCTIQGNFIGINAAGTVAVPNFEGLVVDSSNNTIGGTTPAARNIISGNKHTGMFQLSAANNKIQGNFIGTNVNGVNALGSGIGVILDGGTNNIIGGVVAGARNVISGNKGDGVELIRSVGVQIQGNFIGTDVNGAAGLGNLGDGVLIASDAFCTPCSASNNTLGGAGAAARNIISGNGRYGVEISGSSNNPATDNQVQGNFIGTDVTGANGLGNTLSGVLIRDRGTNNTIGGAVGLGNVIAFNGNGGVIVSNGTSSSDSDGNAILSNSTFSNNGLGIDLGGSGVTPNDAGDADTGPNNLQNFPVITSVNQNNNFALIGGTLDSKSNLTYRLEFFSNPSCDSTGNGEGQKLISSIFLATDANGHASFLAAANMSDLSGPSITATATDPDGATSEFSQCAQLSAALGTFEFGQPTYSVFEDCTGVTITVARAGDSSTAATVDYATQSGTASERSDFDTAIGTLSFAPGETAKTFEVLISEDSFTEGTESFTVALSNSSGGTLGTPATATVQIIDDSPESTTNPIDTADQFVCQHYHDFLNREDDTAGLAFWTNEITSCGSDSACRSVKRINVSAAFFLSIEYQETGGFAIRVQRAAFGKKSTEAGTRITYRQFIHDARFVGDAVVVGQPGFDTRLEANKQAYLNQVVTSSDFVARYATTLTADQYVDALFASAGITPTSIDRQNAINAFNGGGTAGRAAALRLVADSTTLKQAEVNPSFVLMQYFGYLRRNPTDAPDTDDTGYQFWLAKLNSFNGNFIKAEMVKAFISSGEYRSRFGTP